MSDYYEEETEDNHHNHIDSIIPSSTSSPTTSIQFHHYTTHLAHLALFFLFILISFSDSCLHKSFALLYSSLSLLWAWFTFGMPQWDLVAWYLAFLVCLTASLTVGLLGKLGRMCKRRTTGSEHDKAYTTLFAPLHITRTQFSRIISTIRNTRVLSAGDTYAMEKVTRVDSLGLLLSGKLLVTQNGRPLHIILPHQFVDSPEYFSVSTDELFQVTITAVEDSRVVVWHRDKLRLKLDEDEFLREMFDHVIGRDVVRKLIQVSDSVSCVSQLKEHLQVREYSSEQNEPLVEPPEIWSLSKIAEEETCV